ncbi:uncharacterized protein LOC123517008 [Portunus trituberculatus]|uniref:uncharacterized protein LOC123517008 n=1 Tax=Portunus trituberculatus TaxID=210409 RepID=UPI001E1D06D5|nr:uncharacterized protein LOC123517008 [Portunus trituberculatus]
MSTSNRMAGVKKENLLNYARYSRLALTVTARYMAVVFGWLYKGGSLDLEEFLEQQDMTDNFKNPEERMKIKGDPANMDVTCLYKLLCYTCDIPSGDPKWYTAVEAGQKPSLGQILYRLKTIRNSVSHKEPGTLTQVSDEDLDVLAKELEELLAEMLTLAGKKCGQRGDGVAKVICDMMADLARERHADGGITVEEFVTLGREELLKRNKRDLSYVEPRLLMQPGEDTFNSAIPLRELLRSTFHDGSQPQVIQVTGEAGTGKTSLCRALMAWWLMDDPKARALADYQLLLNVTCAHVRSSDLHRYLRLMLPETTKQCDTASLTRLLHEAKILWLVDGWDEATKDAPGLLQDLLQSRGKSHTVLATCRPGFSITLSNQFHGQKIFNVSFARFQREEMKELVRGKLPDVDNTSLENFFNNLHSFPNKEQDDFNNPLKLQLMARVYLVHGLLDLFRQPSLVYIYHNMIECQRKDLILRCKKDAAPGEDVEQKIDVWLERLYKVSFDSAKSDPSLLLTEKSVKILSKECGVPVKLCLSTFLVCASLFGILAHSSSYSFTHDTQRCVLAARHLECCCKGDDNLHAKLRKVLEVDSSELEDHMDPYLGIYDLVTQFLLVIRILLSRISCGWICTEVYQKSFYQSLLRLAKKFVHIVKCDHLPTDRWIQARALRSRLVPVFLQVMEMWTRGLFHVSVSATFLVDLFASLLEGDEEPCQVVGSDQEMRSE